jgi:hypothetical protein
MLRRFLLAIALIASLGSAAVARAADSIAVHAAPVLFDVNNPDRIKAGRLVYRGGLILTSPDSRFGGWSDLSISRDGKRFVSISDNGYWLDADLQHDARGVPSGLTNARLGELIGRTGLPLVKRVISDAEGLAALPDGSFLVTYERFHRIWRYPASDPPFSIAPRALPSPARLREAPDNGGIEAIMHLSDGRLMAFVEELRDGDENVGWIGNGESWSELHYRTAPDFKPTGLAEFPPGTFAAGDVLVLERRFNLFEGFGARIALLRQADLKPGAHLAGIEIARLQAPQTIDNFEGIEIL